MKGFMVLLLIFSGFCIGSLQASRLRSRVRELEVFQGAVLSIKSSAAYTLGDLPTVLTHCRDNAFLALIAEKGDPVQSWAEVSRQYFTYPADRTLAADFLSGFGKTDLAGLLSYIALYESRIERALENARQAASAKCRLYTVLGLFTGTAAALVLC